HEVAGFENTDIFTDRKILFKVLRTVAQQGGGKIIYGGVGGTNISAGVAESHKRLNEFVARLRKEKPEARVVESLFVLTDGQPTMGLTDLQELHDFIEEKRQDGNVAIKGIYLKHPDDKSDFITEIFGAGNAVSADSFEDTVMTFVQVMSRTYQEQRRKFRAAEKRRKMQRGAAAGAGKGSPKPNTEDESLPSSHA
ncbi:MAG: vWA domain-containing protein, partial [Bacteroidota bacterium]